MLTRRQSGVAAHNMELKLTTKNLFPGKACTLFQIYKFCVFNIISGKVRRKCRNMPNQSEAKQEHAPKRSSERAGAKRSSEHTRPDPKRSEYVPDWSKTNTGTDHPDHPEPSLAG